MPTITSDPIAMSMPTSASFLPLTVPDLKLSLLVVEMYFDAAVTHTSADVQCSCNRTRYYPNITYKCSIEWHAAACRCCGNSRNTTW